MDAHERRALPEGWEECDLLKYISLITTGVKSFSGTRKYVETGDLETGKILGYQLVTFENKPSRANQEVKINDVILAKMKDTKKVFIISKEEENYIFSTGFAIMRISKPKKNLPSFLYYWLRTPHFQKNKDKECIGATQKAINTTSLKKFKIILPPLDTQKKIVAALEKAEETKRLRAQADELADRLLQSVFLEMFGDPVKNPKGWEKKKLKCFGDIVTGNTPSRENKSYYGNFIDWIKSDNINTPYTFLTKSDEMLSEEGAKVGRIVPKGSVLVTCIAGSLSCIGNVAIADREVAFNQQINAIIPNKNLNTLFLYHLISNTKEYIQSFSTQSMKGMLSKGVFESIPFILPPLPLQQKFARIVEKIESMRRSQNQSKQQIEDLFSALMQKAFNGELVA